MRMTASLLLMAALLSPANAQEGAPAGRFSLAPVEGGALRLDTETGAMSFCSGEGNAFACRPMPDESAASPAAEAAELENRLAVLERRVAELERRGVVMLPDEESLDRAMTLADRVMRRFFGMVRDMKREMESEEL